MRRTVGLVSVAVTLAFSAVAHAATIFQINGGGDGHGIGMSQYGAQGYARQGRDYKFILSHYYRGTQLGHTSTGQVVGVLLATGQAHFSGASSAGTHKLDPGLTYSVRVLPDGSLGLFKPSGKKLAEFAALLRVTGPGPLDLAGHGLYRGALEFRVAGGRVQTVDAVSLDDYVRGVIAAEMPSSWPMAALEAQAVAARTYAITANVGGNGYSLYADTRSQMYGGVAAETAATDAAAAATSGQIVTYQGAPATTYFFASSGGYTENVENVWLGSPPEPWLKGVRDPYDGAGADPYHRWSERMTLRQAQKTLGSLVRGRLRGIRVTQRGVSPRVISAVVVGTRGTTTVTGPELQSLFGLMSTYMRFTTVSATAVRRPLASVDHLRFPLWRLGTVTGTVYPAASGAAVQIQQWSGKHWRAVEPVTVAGDGTFTVEVATGSYRVLYGGVAGPTVTIG